MSAPCEHELDQGEYTEETSVAADAKGRLALAGAGAKPGRRYIVRHHPDDTITLIPAKIIPEREMIVWENPELARTILQGMDEARSGTTRERDLQFDKYLTDDE